MDNLTGIPDELWGWGSSATRANHKLTNPSVNTLYIFVAPQPRSHLTFCARRIMAACSREPLRDLGVSGGLNWGDNIPMIISWDNPLPRKGSLSELQLAGEMPARLARTSIACESATTIALVPVRCCCWLRCHTRA